jgi:predicted esterase
MRPYLGISVLLGILLGLASCKKEALSTTAPVAPSGKAIQIPGIAEPALNSIDWLSQAYHVEVLTALDSSGESTKAKLAVAWTPTSLLLRVQSEDSTPLEPAKDYGNSDTIEVFIASPFGSNDRLHFVFHPGRTKDQPDPSWQVYDKRDPALPVTAPEIYMENSDSKYTMTISIPWTNFKRIPKPGDVLGLQVLVNDVQPNGQVSHRGWFPNRDTDWKPELMQHVQLAGRADAPEIAAAWLQLKGLDELVHVSASADDVGKKIELWVSDKLVASGELKTGGPDGSYEDIPLSSDWAKEKDTPLLITVDGNLLPNTLKMPDLAGHRVELIKKLPLVANPSIFDGVTFPKIEFLNKEIVEAAIGSYSLHTRFFDAGWNEVTAPQAPGRYGALVEFKSADGLTFTRGLTLFKTPQPYTPAKDPYDVSVKFPAAFGLSPEAVAREQWNISNWVGGILQNQARNDSNGAVLVAGLHDLAADPNRWHGLTAWTVDDFWWSELHKRLGENQDYKYAIKLPDGYDVDKKEWPLILFLHGTGERGNDLSLLNNQGPLGYINAGHKLPFIVVEPQCPADEWWSSARLSNLIDQLATAYRVDADRIYVTGLSMGGYGSFDLAANYPEKVAALAPLSGGANPEIAGRLKKIPTWIFHGDSDSVVPTRYSVDVFHAMQKAGAPVKLTIYPGVGHWGWDKTYADPAFYAWLLQQSK